MSKQKQKGYKCDQVTFRKGGIETGGGGRGVKSNLGKKRQHATGRTRLGSVMPPTEQGPHGMLNLEP